MPSSTALICIAVALILGIVSFSGYELYASGRTAGSTKVELQQSTAQLKLNHKTQGDYATIDKSAPYSADDDTAIWWLLNYTSASQ